MKLRGLEARMGIEHERSHLNKNLKECESVPITHFRLNYEHEHTLKRKLSQVRIREQNILEKNILGKYLQHFSLQMYVHRCKDGILMS